MKRRPAPEKRILEAAIRCIEKVGIQAATTRRIAEIAGVNSAAINYYFRSKQALLERALEATTENAIGDWERIVTDPAVAPEDRLRAVLRELLEGQWKFPNLTKAHLHGPIMEKDFDTVFARRFRAFLSRARDALALPGKKADAEKKLAALFSAVVGWGMLGGLFDGFPNANPARPECRSRYVEFLLQRLLAD